MRYRNPYIWKQAPFLRLLLPLIAGILLQYYIQPPVFVAWAVLSFAVTAILLFNLRPSFIQFKFSWFNGVMMFLLFISLGTIVGFYKNITHHTEWYGHHVHEKSGIFVTIEEPLSEREKSYRALAAAEQVVNNDSIIRVKGSLLLYFPKDSANLPVYGSRLFITKHLQRITSSGNPGAFDYQQYAALQNLYHQVFLKKGEYFLLPGRKTSWLSDFLLHVRAKVLHILTAYIPGDKEAGMAEALLVGYKEDLDKELVQSYSNTGVVHVIAISGLHLGLIYWLLSILFTPLQRKWKLPWLKATWIIIGLWLFALLAGAGPSILRSAVMFTCIVIGDSLQKKSPILNSLAMSACILLCMQPGWIWDVGFQLSYAAVLSIVIFMKPIYNLIYVRNKLLDTIWKLSAVTFAAQILTVPLCVYYFHQFPNYFLLANMVAVPLSSLIVLGEIALCVLAVFPVLAKLTGAALHALIVWMNDFIERIDHLPFARWESLQVNLLQVMLVYAVIAGTAYWLMQKNKTALLSGLLCMVLLLSVKFYATYEANYRKQLVVYNVPGHTIMDIMDNGKYFNYNGTNTAVNMQLVRFHIAPARILYHCSKPGSIDAYTIPGGGFLFNHKKIIVIDKKLSAFPFPGKIQADIVIISQNQKITLDELRQKIDCRQWVLDASNPAWKVNKWKSEAAKAGLNCFSMVDNGAFVMNLN